MRKPPTGAVCGRTALLIRTNPHRRWTGDAKSVRTRSEPTDAASLLCVGLDLAQTRLLLGRSRDEDWYESGPHSRFEGRSGDGLPDPCQEKRRAPRVASLWPGMADARTRPASRGSGARGVLVWRAGRPRRRPRADPPQVPRRRCKRLQSLDRAALARDTACFPIAWGFACRYRGCDRSVPGCCLWLPWIRTRVTGLPPWILSGAMPRSTS